MKARLVWLSILCCAFLFSLSLMMADAASKESAEPAYTQSMVLPVQTVAITSSEFQLKYAKIPTAPMHWLSVQAGDDLVQTILPEQFHSYHDIVYYAFHYSDEAG